MTSLLPFKVLIDLDKAVLVSYEALKNTELGRGAENSGLGLLNLYAHHLVRGKTLYGKSPPSRKIEIINQDKMGWIEGDGKHTTNNGGRTICDGLMIERKDMIKFIKAHKLT